MLNLLSFGNSECIEHVNQPLGTKQAHQVILKGNVKPGHTRVSLTSGTAAQLVVDTPRLVALRTDNHQTACRPCLLVKLDIRTTACHVGSDGHCTVLSGIRHDFRLKLMEFCVQYLVLDAAP